MPDESGTSGINDEPEVTAADQGRLPQTVVSVEISGTPFRVARIQDNPARNRLIVSPLHPINLEVGNESIPISETHISAWINEEPGQVELHLSYRLAAGEVERANTWQTALLNGGDYASTFLTMSVPYRDLREPDVPRARYEVYHLPAYDEMQSCLVVCYAFATTGQVFPDLTHVGIDCLQISYPKLQVAIYYTYLATVSFVRGRVQTNSTTLLHPSGQPRYDICAPIARTMSDLSGWVKNSVEICIAEYMGMLRSHIPQMPENCINSIVPLSQLRADERQSFSTLQGTFDIDALQDIEIDLDAVEDVP